jgi:hypothetical protein
MHRSVRLVVAGALVLASASAALAQTADEIIEKHLAAIGGRAALGKITSRSTTGTITLGTPAGDMAGSVELLNARPNKVRTLIKVDLSSLGAGQLVVDQRFDGRNGYVLDSLQGNRDMTGNQLDNLRNSSFPNALMNYKELGFAASLKGKEKVGDKDAYVLSLEPATGSIVRQYIDADSYMLVKQVVKVEVPQLGQEIEQTTEFSDFRDVDGLKLPFTVRASSSVQNFTISIGKIENNVAVDETLFAKPAPR